MTTPTDAQPTDYFLEIESHFAARRGTPFLFSSKDWALLKSWSEEGIPLAVVLEAIDHCFDKRAESGRKGTISSLRYCRHAVKQTWEERKDLAVGSGGDLPELDPRGKLEALAAQLENAAELAGPDTAASLLRDAAGQVRATAGRTVPQIEEGLMAIEQALFDQLSTALGAGEWAALEREVDQLLAVYTSLQPETREKTRQANLRRLLRRRVGLPRLSLFG